MTNADAIAIVALLRYMQSEPLSFDTYSVAGAAERAANAIEALRTALTASEKRRRETDMLAYKWMVAHDRLAAGLQYEFPSTANIPDALARVNELETFVRSVQVPTKDGTWKEVMFRLADEARVILAKGERS